jgi:hypothetical protein
MDAAQRLSDRVPTGVHGDSDPQGLTPVSGGCPRLSRHTREGRIARDVLIRRQNTITEKAGALHYNDGRYGASFGDQTFDFAPASPTPDPTLPHLKLALGSITDGATVLASAGPAERKLLADERAIEFHRGGVVERYEMRSDGVEQSFVLNGLPERGAVTAFVKVSSSHPGTAENGDLDFGGIFVRDAVAIDAAGRRLELPMELVEGGFTMTVPEEWIATAALPVVIDPLVGTAIMIDTMTWGTWFRPAQVAWNSNNTNWLVVWNEQVGASAFDYDLWAQRVETNATLLGAPIPVAVGPEGAYEAAVAYAPGPNRFMIAWRGDPADNGDATDQQIYGRMVRGNNGTFYNNAAILDGDVNDDYNPRLSYGNNRFYLCFTAVVAPNLSAQPDWDIQGSFWSNTMAFVSTRDPQAGVVNLANNANAAHDSGSDQHLIVWEESPSAAGGVVGTRGVRGRRLGSISMNFNGGTLTIDQSTMDSFHPSVVWAETRWMVVWDEKKADTNGTIMRRRVNTNGSFPSAAAQVATVEYGYPGINAGGWPAVGYSDNKNQSFIVWHTYVLAEDAWSVMGRRVNNSNTLLGTEETIIQAAWDVDARFAQLALRPGNNTFLIVAWDSWEPGAIRAQRWQYP